MHVHLQGWPLYTGPYCCVWVSLFLSVFKICTHFFFHLVCEAIGTAATPGLLCQPRVIVKMIVEKQMECRLAGETEVLLEENLPQRHFCSSQNPTWPDPGLNPGCHGGKPATNRLSYGAASQQGIVVVVIWFVRLLALRPLLAYCANLGW
jgi:hypothetical protein